MQQLDIIRDNVLSIAQKLWELILMIIQHLNNVFTLAHHHINIFNKINVKMVVQEIMHLL